MNPNTRIILTTSILVIFILSSFGFYWFEWRPSQKRKECTQTTAQALKGFSGSGASLDSARVLYEFCLHKTGIEG